MRRLVLLSLALLPALLASSPASAEVLGVGDGGMWLISDDGSTRELVNNRWQAEPTWSPDGERIAFGVNRRGALRLVTGPPAGPFTDVPGSEGLAEPAWSPDGTTLAAVRGQEIVTIPVAGGAPFVVTTGGDDESPAWRPDGGEIAFVRVPPETDDTGPGNPGALMAVRPDGSALRTLTPDAAQPDWSPDGTRIVFSSTRDENGETCENEGTEEAFCLPNSEIYVIRADGTGAQRLTDDSDDDIRPTWAPDGSRIAFAADRHWRTNELWVMDADGTCVTQLTVGWGSMYDAAWRPGRPVERGPCGVRRATYEELYDPSELLIAVREPDTDPLFPGLPFRSMHPMNALKGFLDYNECSATRRTRCGGRITLSTYTTCRRNPARTIVPPTRVETIRGALVLHFFYRVQVFAGGTMTEIYADEGKRPFLRDVVRALRPLRRPNARGRLAAPQLPDRVWRALAATDRVRRGAKRTRLNRTDRQVLAALGKLRAGRRPACAR